MNTGALSSAGHNWQSANQWPKTDDRERLASSEKQRLTEDIEKEESELKRITQEFSKHLSNGEQDKAKLKSAEMAQKQLRIQALRSQISALEKSAQGSVESNPVADETTGPNAKFDQFVKSGELPEETAGIYRLGTDEDGNPKILFDSPDDSKKKQVEVAKSVSDDARR